MLAPTFIAAAVDNWPPVLFNKNKLPFCPICAVPAEPSIEPTTKVNCEEFALVPITVYAWSKVPVTSVR